MAHIIMIRDETPIIELIQPDSGAFEIADYNLSAMVGDSLQRTYPGYSWLVRADHRGGVLRILCGEISASVRSNLMPGMTMHISTLHDWGITLKAVIRQAGELLERARLKRGRWDGQFPTYVDGLRDHEQPGFKPRIVLIGS